MKSLEKLLNVAEVELSYKSHIKPADRLKISDEKDVYSLARSLLEDRIEHLEEMYMVLLDQALKVLGVALVSKGGVCNTVVDLRIIFQTAILANASRIILVHNHPSGDPTPSNHDIKETLLFNKSSKILGINFLDHIIIGDNNFFSFKKHNII